MADTALMVLIDMAVKSVALLLAAGIAAVALRRASAATRHLVWLAALGGLLVLPVLALGLPALRVLPAFGDAAAEPAAPAPAVAGTTATAPPPAAAPLPPPVVLSDTAPVAAPPPPPVADVAAEPDPGAPLNWRPWLLAAYGLGVALTLAPLGLGLVSLFRLGRAASRITAGPWPVLLDACRREMGVRRPVVLLRSDARTMPMTWGGRPFGAARLLLPSDADTWPPERRRAVLLHELAHVKRGDALTHLVAQLARALYWFNPLAWVAVSRLAVERERACDDAVLASGGLASDYAEHLLAIASTCRTPLLLAGAPSGGMARPSTLEGRIRAILDPRRNRRAVTAGMLAIATLIAAAVVVPVAMLRAQDTQKVQGIATNWEDPPGATTVTLAALNDEQASVLDLSTFSVRPKNNDETLPLGGLGYDLTREQIVAIDGARVAPLRTLNWPGGEFAQYSNYIFDRAIKETDVHRGFHVASVGPALRDGRSSGQSFFTARDAGGGLHRLYVHGPDTESSTIQVTIAPFTEQEPAASSEQSGADEVDEQDEVVHGSHAIAALPNGVTIALVGLAQGDYSQRAWFMPSGEPIEDSGDEWMIEQVSAWWDQGWRPGGTLLYVFVAAPQLHDSSFAQLSLHSGDGTLVAPSLAAINPKQTMFASPGKDRPGWMMFQVRVEPEINLPASTTLRLRYVEGPWQQVAEVPLDADPGERIDTGVTLTGLGKRPNDNTFISISVEQAHLDEHDYQIVARTLDGRTVTPSGQLSYRTQEPSVLTFEFRQELSRLQDFIVRKSAMQTGEFRNVSLKPGHRTAPTAEALGSRSDAAAPEVNEDPFDAFVVPEPLEYDIQRQHYDIQPDGSIRFRSFIHQLNRTDSPVTSVQFMNSDFVNVERMFDTEGRPLQFTTEHVGDTFHYRVKLNEPVPTGGTITYGSEGVTTGLVHHIARSDLYEYRMRHHPGGTQTQRIEHHHLPKGARLLEHSDNLSTGGHDGRALLRLDAMVEGGGSVEARYRYVFQQAQRLPERSAAAPSRGPAPIERQVVEDLLLRLRTEVDTSQQQYGENHHTTQYLRRKAEAVENQLQRMAQEPADRLSRSSVFVLGSVDRAGAYAVPEGGELTLLQLLAAAGGNAVVLEPGEFVITIVRADGERRRIDAADLVGGGAEPVKLGPGDTVVVQHQSAAEATPSRRLER